MGAAVVEGIDLSSAVRNTATQPLEVLITRARRGDPAPHAWHDRECAVLLYVGVFG